MMKMGVCLLHTPYSWTRLGCFNRLHIHTSDSLIIIYCSIAFIIDWWFISVNWIIVINGTARMLIICMYRYRFMLLHIQLLHNLCLFQEVLIVHGTLLHRLDGHHCGSCSFRTLPYCPFHGLHTSVNTLIYINISIQRKQHFSFTSTCSSMPHNTSAFSTKLLSWQRIHVHTPNCPFPNISFSSNSHLSTSHMSKQINKFTANRYAYTIEITSACSSTAS